MNGSARRRALWQGLIVAALVLALTWIYGWHPAAGGFASVCALLCIVMVQTARHR